MTPSPESFTGRMRCVCMHCKAEYGGKPCLPEQHGRVSHGWCPACAPAELAKIEGLEWVKDFVAVEQVAEVCGLPVPRVVALQPREWKAGVQVRQFEPMTLWRHGDLPLFAAQLAVSGEGAAASKLMRWLLASLPEEAIGVEVAPAPVPIVHCGQSTVKPTTREGWAEKWEKEHNE